jgi:hypothetical protein
VVVVVVVTWRLSPAQTQTWGRTSDRCTKMASELRIDRRAFLPPLFPNDNNESAVLPLPAVVGPATLWLFLFLLLLLLLLLWWWWLLLLLLLGLWLLLVVEPICFRARVVTFRAASPRANLRPGGILVVRAKSQPLRSKTQSGGSGSRLLDRMLLIITK